MGPGIGASGVEAAGVREDAVEATVGVVVRRVVGAAGSMGRAEANAKFPAITFSCVCAFSFRRACVYF